VSPEKRIAWPAVAIVRPSARAAVVADLWRKRLKKSE
jgi:hypothetical protein